ncbi:hypothetical protein AKJ09_01482 [Labilithrix luteola]|uniref:Uncharacterized protein n=2 Tax=Labilithrix luteola TaxID=1391654 RepID=A0A0K1PMR7_9BACT|nr:hypothetical protein AKJ09_01482 [Labilithrix luteola]
MTFASQAYANAAFASDESEPSPSVEAISVAYTADGACPTKERFLASVRRYTTKWKETEANGSARSFDVRFVTTRTGVAGKLVVRTADGRSSTRELPGPECDGVARAVAIIMAVAIDPRALGAAPTDEPPPEAPPEPTADTVPPADVVTVAEPRRADRVAPPVAPKPPSKKKDVVRFAVEAGAELTSIVTGTAIPVFDAGVEMRFDLGRSVPAWLAPSVGLALRQSLPSETKVPGGSSEALWSAAAIRLCPLRVAVGRFELVPCAEANVGILRVEARGVADARRTATAWFDRGGSLRATFRLGERWAIGADAVVTAPVTRNRYTLANGDFVSQAPVVGVTGGLFGALRL